MFLKLMGFTLIIIYHSHRGFDGYRTIHAYLIRTGYDISRLTVHKYMNTEMQLFSIPTTGHASASTNICIFLLKSTLSKCNLCAHFDFFQPTHFGVFPHSV